MKRRIKHISIHQTSKVIAAMHTAMITILFILPSALGYIFHHQIIFGLIFLLVTPWIIWLFIYIGYVIACWFYNLVVPWVGGIEFTMTNLEPQPQTTEPTPPEPVAPPNRMENS